MLRFTGIIGLTTIITMAVAILAAAPQPAAAVPMYTVRDLGRYTVEGRGLNFENRDAVTVLPDGRVTFGFSGRSDNGLYEPAPWTKPSDRFFQHAGLRGPDGRVERLISSPGHMSTTFAANDEGQAVGAVFAGANTLPFVGKVGPGAHFIGNEGFEGMALDVNNLGQVVGIASGRSSSDDNRNNDAFLHDIELDTLDDLNDYIPTSSGWHLVQATGINDAGSIGGYGYAPDGLVHAFLLTPTPVPEPTASVLLACGMTPMAARSRLQGRLNGFGGAIAKMRLIRT